MSFNKNNKLDKSNNLSNLTKSQSSHSDDLSGDDLSEKEFEPKMPSEEQIRDEKIQDMLNRMSTKPKTYVSSEKKQRDSNVLNYDEVEFDKLEENERKALKDLFTGLPDIYKITGTTPDDSQATINKKCAEKLKMYHPDRHNEIVKKYPEELRAKELKKLDIQFKLIRDADSILRDPAKRKYYDLQKKTIQSKNFVAQKQSFEEFIKLQESKISEHSRSLAENDHKMSFLAMDKKHGFDRKKFEEAALTKEETDRRYSDLMDGRDQDKIEFIPKNRFENIAFNQEDFNKMFLKNKLKEEKKRGKIGEDKSLVVWEGISAMNDVGMDGATDFVSIEHDYENLYTDKNFAGSSLFASKLDSDIDDESINSESSFDMGNDIDLDELDGYKFNKEDINSRFEEMMNRRNMENQEYDNRQMHDKNSWKSVLDNPFTISASMGTVLGGKDFSKLEGPKHSKTINKEYADVYKSLVYDTNDLENLEKKERHSKREKKDKKEKKHKKSHSSKKNDKRNDEKN